MRKILSILTARWFITLIGVLLLSTILWFVGPLFAFNDVRPLDSASLIRVVAIAALLVIWAFAVAWSIVRSRSANARLVDDMAQQAPASGGGGGGGDRDHPRPADLEGADRACAAPAWAARAAVAGCTSCPGTS